MNENVIRIKGANEHNLKNFNLTIPRDKLVVFTGLSGLIRSSPKDSGATWNLCPLMPACSWDRWKSRM